MSDGLKEVSGGRSKCQVDVSKCQGVVSKCQVVVSKRQVVVSKCQGVVSKCQVQGGIFQGNQGARFPQNLQAHTKCWQKFTRICHKFDRKVFHAK